MVVEAREAMGVVILMLVTGSNFSKASACIQRLDDSRFCLASESLGKIYLERAWEILIIIIISVHSVKSLYNLQSRIIIEQYFVPCVGLWFPL